MKEQINIKGSCVIGDLFVFIPNFAWNWLNGWSSATQNEILYNICDSSETSLTKILYPDNRYWISYFPSLQLPKYLNPSLHMFHCTARSHKRYMWRLQLYHNPKKSSWARNTLQPKKTQTWNIWRTTILFDTRYTFIPSST